MKAKSNRITKFSTRTFLFLAAAVAVCATTFVRADDPMDGMAKVLDGYVTSERIAGVVSVLSDRDYHVQFDCVGWA